MIINYALYSLVMLMCIHNNSVSPKDHGEVITINYYNNL